MKLQHSTDASPKDSGSPKTVVTVTIKPAGKKPQKVELRFAADKKRLRVGRDPLNELLLETPRVSRFHAALLLRADGRLLLSDLGSESGTFLNGQQLDAGETYELNNHDAVRFGDVETDFSWAEESEPLLSQQSAGVSTREVAQTILSETKETDAVHSAVSDETLPSFSTASAAAIEEETVVKKPEKPQTSVARSAGIVSIAVMGSRVMGLVREMVFAAFFGAGFLYDAFLVGFRIPNLLRDLFAEGALSAAFVKVFTDYQIKRSEAEAWRLASLIFNALAVVLSAITILGIIFSSQIVRLITYNYTGDPNYFYAPEKAALATSLMQIMFPFILLVALAALAMGVLNTKGRFGIPASASTAFNIVSILAGLGLAFYLSGGAWETSNDKNLIPSEAAQRAIIGMAIGTLLGGAAQFLIQVPSLWQVGFRFSPVLNFRDEGVRRVARLMAPALLGVSAVQIKVLVDTALVSGIDGGQSWLSYSFRLMQFPIGVFGVALGTAAIPTLSRFASENDFASFRKTLSNAINLVFLLTLPSACGLIFLGEPIIRLIYERGRFDQADTAMTAWALIGYSIGLTGYAAIKIVSPAFYALDDAKTPMMVSLASILVHVATGYTMMKVLSGVGVTPDNPNGLAHVGVTLATSTVALINFLALAILMRAKIKRIEGRQMLQTLLKIAVASALLSAVCYFSYRFLASFLGTDGLIVRLIEVFVPMALGGTVFLLAAKLLGVAELNQAVDAFARKLRRK